MRRGKSGKRRWMSALWLGLAMSSCSNDDRRFSPSLPPESVVGQLDGTQRHTLCEEEVAYFKHVFGPSQCPGYGVRKAAMWATGDPTVTDQVLRTECQDRRQLCFDFITPGGLESCIRYTSACGATVDDLAACMTDANDFFYAQEASVPACETLTGARAIAFDQRPFSSAVCARVLAECPEAGSFFPESLSVR